MSNRNFVDGAGPGSLTSLAMLFRDHDQVWVQIEIGGEILTLRVQVQAAAYALNSSHLEGKSAADIAAETSVAVSRRRG